MGEALKPSFIKQVLALNQSKYTPSVSLLIFCTNHAILGACFKSLAVAKVLSIGGL